MKKIISFLLFLFLSIGMIMAGTVTDTLTASDFAATSTTYTDFSDVSKNSNAVYSGQSAKNPSGYIQLRSKNSNSGIVTTVSGGTVKSVKITVGTGSNTIDVYGSHSAYSAASNLYANNTKGIKVGSLTETGTITFPADSNFTYIGIRSNNGAIYLSQIEIVWTVSGDNPDPQPTKYTITYALNGGTGTVPTQASKASGETFTVAIATGITPPENKEFSTWNDGTDNYAPGSIYTVGTSNVTLTAQWNDVTTPVEGLDTFTLGFSGDYYIICGDSVVFDGSLTILDDNRNRVTFANRAKTNMFTFAPVGNTSNITIKSNSGYYIGQTGDSNGLLSDTTITYTNKITFNEDTTVDIISSGGAHLRYNSASNQLRFRYYKSSTYTAQKAIKLYRDGEMKEYRTLYLTYPTLIPDGVEVYTAELYGEVVILTEVKDSIPANTGVIVKANIGNYYFIETDPVTELVNNILTGGETTREANYIYYALHNGSHGVGFYKYTGTELPSNKAYIKIPSGGNNAPEHIKFEFATDSVPSDTITTRLSTITPEPNNKAYKFIRNGQIYIKKNNVTYNILGVKVEED